MNLYINILVRKKKKEMEKGIIINKTIWRNKANCQPGRAIQHIPTKLSVLNPLDQKVINPTDKCSLDGRDTQNPLNTAMQCYTYHSEGLN